MGLCDCTRDGFRLRRTNHAYKDMMQGERRKKRERDRERKGGEKQTEVELGVELKEEE